MHNTSNPHTSHQSPLHSLPTVPNWRLSLYFNVTLEVIRMYSSQGQSKKFQAKLFRSGVLTRSHRFENENPWVLPYNQMATSRKGEECLGMVLAQRTHGGRQCSYIFRESLGKYLPNQTAGELVGIQTQVLLSLVLCVGFPFWLVILWQLFPGLLSLFRCPRNDG